METVGSWKEMSQGKLETYASCPIELKQPELTASTMFQNQTRIRSSQAFSCYISIYIVHLSDILVESPTRLDSSNFQKSTLKPGLLRESACMVDISALL